MTYTLLWLTCYYRSPPIPLHSFTIGVVRKVLFTSVLWMMEHIQCQKVNQGTIILKNVVTLGWTTNMITTIASIIVHRISTFQIGTAMMQFASWLETILYQKVLRCMMTWHHVATPSIHGIWLYAMPLKAQISTFKSLYLKILKP